MPVYFRSLATSGNVHIMVHHRNFRMVCTNALACRICCRMPPSPSAFGFDAPPMRAASAQASNSIPSAWRVPLFCADHVLKFNCFQRMACLSSQPFRSLNEFRMLNLLPDTGQLRSHLMHLVMLLVGTPWRTKIRNMMFASLFKKIAHPCQWGMASFRVTCLASFRPPCLWSYRILLFFSWKRAHSYQWDMASFRASCLCPGRILLCSRRKWHVLIIGRWLPSGSPACGQVVLLFSCGK